jgi:hypothetical protein
VGDPFTGTSITMPEQLVTKLRNEHVRVPVNGSLIGLRFNSYQIEFLCRELIYER